MAPRNVMISNDEVAGFAAEHPDRLVGIGSVDISNPMHAIAEIRRHAEELSFRGSACCLGCRRFRGRTAGLPARPAAAGVLQRNEAKVFGGVPLTDVA